MGLPGIVRVKSHDNQMMDAPKGHDQAATILYSPILASYIYQKPTEG